MLFLGVAVVLSLGGTVTGVHGVYVGGKSMYMEESPGVYVKLRREYSDGRSVIRTMTV